MLDGFPPGPITSYNKTIQELHLEGSLLTQKIYLKTRKIIKNLKILLIFIDRLKKINHKR